MSTTSYTPTIKLGLDLTYYKELKILFYSNKSCLTSINSSTSTSITTIIKGHLIKHKISLKDTLIKEFLTKVEKYSLAPLATLENLEHYKYYFKELEVINTGYLYLVNSYNKVFTTTKAIYKHIEEHKKTKEIPLSSIKKNYYRENLKV